MNKNQTIQILRGILFFIILLYHLNTPAFTMGWMYIEFFFCLSGFFIFKKISNIASETKEFKFTQMCIVIKDRILRLYIPTYLLLVVASLLLAISINQIGGVTHIPSYFVSLQNYEWAVHGMDGVYMLPHTWTVAIEIHAIIIICVLIWLSYRSFHGIRFVPIVLIIISLIWGMIAVKVQNKYAYSLCTLSHLISFGFGGVVYNNTNKKNYSLKKGLPFIISTAAAGLICITLLIFYACAIKAFTINDTIVSTFHDASVDIRDMFPLSLLYGGIALLSSAVVQLCVSIQHKYSSKLMTFMIYIGDNSYELYLLHYPIALVVKNYISIDILRFFIAFGITLVGVIVYKMLLKKATALLTQSHRELN